MSDRTKGLFTCDLCGERMSEAYCCKLFARYRTPEVSEVCGECQDKIKAAWEKACRVTDGLLNDLTRRAIRVLRRRMRVKPRGMWERT